MVGINLLHEVRKALSHKEITLFEAMERRAYTGCNSDYGYRFEIALKRGMYHLDKDSGKALVDLHNTIFERLYTEKFKLRGGEFEGMNDVNWGVFDSPGHSHWMGENILSIPILRVEEPVGVREERDDAYTAHSRFYLLPQFTSEFSPEEGRGENHIPHKETVSRKPITRIIDVALFPSLEYLRELSEIHRERDALVSLNLGMDTTRRERKGYDEIKEREKQLGFVDINSISISDYNRFFVNKINGDPC